MWQHRQSNLPSSRRRPGPSRSLFRAGIASEIPDTVSRQTLTPHAEVGRWAAPAFHRTLSGMRQPCVYLLASRYHGTLYIGVTSDLVQRVWQHRHDVFEGFTKRYGVRTLVWYEAHEEMYTAIVREKAIKEWRRAWKIRLIEAANPQWKDLYPSIL